MSRQVRQKIKKVTFIIVGKYKSAYTSPKNRQKMISKLFYLKIIVSIFNTQTLKHITGSFQCHGDARSSSISKLYAYPQAQVTLFKYYQHFKLSIFKSPRQIWGRHVEVSLQIATRKFQFSNYKYCPHVTVVYSYSDSNCYHIS